MPSIVWTSSIRFFSIGLLAQDISGLFIPPVEMYVLVPKLIDLKQDPSGSSFSG
jgi:hypothetical protein